jgi:large subunit ribosomal protein L14e
MKKMEIGTVCVKFAGREAGEKCVVVDTIDKNFVMVDSPKIKRRRCNLRHLEPTDKKIKIKKGASSEEIKKALEKENISLEAGA